MMYIVWALYSIMMIIVISGLTVSWRERSAQMLALFSKSFLAIQLYLLLFLLLQRFYEV